MVEDKTESKDMGCTVPVLTLDIVRQVLLFYFNLAGPHNTYTY